MEAGPENCYECYGPTTRKSLFGFIEGTFYIVICILLQYLIPGEPLAVLYSLGVGGLCHLPIYWHGWNGIISKVLRKSMYPQ